ncbi:hypothetical protein [Kocuria flava]|uniref:hypothetical protein n=1 Tax=Kocuria flava TaxID=446860 RepID=UPI001C5EF663|nr:hypothetical protein [Kocuria flava]
MTAVVVLAASQLLYAFEAHTDYGTALHEAALATVTGSGITTDDPFSKVLQVVLAVYSVAVFATLAGSLGAYFLRGQDPAARPDPRAPGSPGDGPAGERGDGR